jgi:predicted phage-related endonuclease
MNNFDLKKYLAEGQLFKEEQENVNSPLSNVENLKQQLQKLEDFRVGINNMVVDLDTKDNNYDDIEDFITIDFESSILGLIQELENFIEELE